MSKLTKPLIEQITAKDATNNTEIVVENEKLIISQPLERKTAELVGGSYDDVQGVLVLSFANGEVLRVTGFPTSLNMPSGAIGLKGMNGKDGNDGKDGKKGEKGEKGEIGDQGPMGERGERGLDGRKGERGDKGEQGIRGNIGPKGEDGDRGPRGHVGPDGKKGEGGKGEIGDKGPNGDLNIIVSSTEPANAETGTLWVNPNTSPPIYNPPQQSSGTVTDPQTGLTDPAPGSVVWP